MRLSAGLLTKFDEKKNFVNFCRGKQIKCIFAIDKNNSMRTDYVIYHKGVAYTEQKALETAIGQNNANKAILRAKAQKVDKTIWRLRKCGKYEIHLK